jgi:hypothetical protein
MQDARPYHNDNVQLLLPPINPPPHRDTFIASASDVGRLFIHYITPSLWLHFHGDSVKEISG